jgi:predicted NAD/FAD-binding protein
METDWMNNLQCLPSQKHGHLFATLNPLFPPHPVHVLAHYAYAYPVPPVNAVGAQNLLAQLNSQVAGRHRTFAGAWTRYGFHEDGFASGLHTAAALAGVIPPFEITDADAELREPRLGAMIFLFDMLEVMRAIAGLFFGRVLLIVVAATGPIKQKVN